MKVQLIHPPLYLNVHAMTALRPSLPLGLAYIAAALRKAGFEVSVVDAVAEAPEQVTRSEQKKSLYALGLTPDEIVARLDPDAAAFGLTNMWTFSWPLVREICQKLKARFPDKPLVCGGEHFSGLPELSMQQAPIDFVVRGEGEEAAVEVFSGIRIGVDRVDWSQVKGIWYRDAGGRPTESREPRARKKDVDEIAWPAWDLFDIDVYNQQGFINGLDQGQTVPILATRGCPYQCTYCASPNMWTTRWYARSPKDVVDEMQHYKERFGATNFPFQDLTAILKRDWIIDFCNELKQRQLNVTWQFPSGTRCEVIDDEVARLLYETGGRSLALAPESGSERTRKLIQKRMKTESLMDAVKASVRNKLNVTIFIVIAFPHDTADDLRETARMCRKLGRLGIDDIAVGFFFPIPNTQLYRELTERGRVSLEDRFLLTPIFANEQRLLPENNYCDHLSAGQLTRWKYKLLLNFYLTSFLFHPLRPFRIAWNALRGKETRKLETYLVDVRRKLGVALRNRFRGKARKKAEPATA
ncbi:MAG: B12-binding domain-containing radical SAM protein [Planctomycetes bacterium]|nr:B12-binding domain-containing radical SAM protein [Planctomycetota bacterium]